MFSEHKDESHDYLLCNNLPTLLWLAQSWNWNSTWSRARPVPIRRRPRLFLVA